MESQSVSKVQLWSGRVLSGLAIAFLLLDGIGKFFLESMPKEALEDAAKLDYPIEIMPYIGITLLICTVLYALPKTTVLGAILLTGYLGGAVASHVRILNPWGSHILFPVYVGIFIWLGLYLRTPELRAFIPWRK
ncbi:DoxX family protein [Leptospira ilyithenensis]|uniref:DoxX family protein n=1 Tax=Leptospira ilyithenensis TaxID=2484901 RepID=A0A4R9LX88_9LEPT|nr:DoxX family protein [Leptospira ilyithenensis]TGN16796.1 DoxX family protein [Leptospira ilyithenensis]